MQCVERVGKQSHQSYQDQIDGDQVVQQARQDQDQDSEQQRYQGLPSDNIDMHEKTPFECSIKSSRQRGNPRSGRIPDARESPKMPIFRRFLLEAGEKRKNLKLQN